jgi:hypothetical protein
MRLSVFDKALFQRRDKGVVERQWDPPVQKILITIAKLSRLQRRFCSKDASYSKKLEDSGLVQNVSSLLFVFFLSGYPIRPE